MALGKFKLSETLRFLSHRVNAIAHLPNVELEIASDGDPSHPGGEVRARVILRGDDAAHEIDYIALTMRGTVQRDGEWRDYTEGAEVAQGMSVPAEHEVVLPVIIYIPEDAVPTVDGGSWVLEARAIVDRAVDPRARLDFTVELPNEGSEEE